MLVAPCKYEASLGTAIKRYVNGECYFTGELLDKSGFKGSEFRGVDLYFPLDGLNDTYWHSPGDIPLGEITWYQVCS